tara:strand:- start:129 stop:326 length:198 start_codon:yes stop_codon:yes gene_type:complete
MGKEKCLGCNELFSTDWPAETDGKKSLSSKSARVDYWYVCPHCKGKNIVTWDNEDKMTVDRFEKV